MEQQYAAQAPAEASALLGQGTSITAGRVGQSMKRYRHFMPQSGFKLHSVNCRCRA